MAAMAATPVAFSTRDSATGVGTATGLLNAGISAAATSIVLQSGNGANFPQPYSSTATSAGTSTTLNSTGISAAIGGSAQEGKLIWNKTDGSVAVIVTVSTDSLTTTRLLGGTTNLWNNSDRWCIDPFVGTLAALSGSTITKSEEVLIIGRSSDTLTVATGGRGYNGTTADSFTTGDSFYLFVTSPIVERLKDVLSVTATQVNTNVTSINNLNVGAPYYADDSGAADAYAVTLSPAPTAYSAGMIVNFKATNANTTTSTLNVNSLGTKTIKKHGNTNLATNDILANQLVTVVYDGTNFQMQSGLGNAPLSTGSIGFYGDGSDGAVTWSVSTNLDPATEKRYTTATLNAGQTLSVSSVNTPLVIHNTSNVTINGTVDLNGKGGAGVAGDGDAGASGTAGNSLVSGWTTGAGGGGSGNAGGGGSGASILSAGSAGSNGGGTGGTAGSLISANRLAELATLLRGGACGGGGGSGAGGGGTNGGDGGAGGGCLFWFIGGNLTLGGSSIIRANGAAGGNAAPVAASGGGGGGGGGGTIVILVAGTITNSGVTASATGGAGGSPLGGGGGAGATGADGKVMIYSLSTGTLVVA